MIESLRLAIRRVSDPGLNCIVCRRMRVDAQIVYGTVGGTAAQGIHLRCIGRAQVMLGRGRRRAAEPTTATYEDGIQAAANVAQQMAWDVGVTGIASNRNPVLEIHKAILALPSPMKGHDSRRTR